MFSRLSSDLHRETNPLYRLRDSIAAEGRQITDLISGNVTEHGIAFPASILEDILASAARTARLYRPDPLGQPAARQAIAGYYADQGLAVPAGQILLAPGTSIAYFYCFKLLADEGDEILCPRPSYPLFEYIASLSGVKVVSYPLDESRGWGLDPDRMESQISTHTRAIVVISPHNPTGHVASAEELRGVADVAARHRVAVISDEVFSEFRLTARSVPRPAATAAPLVITLNGFSKMFALPGIKLGWMVVTGEEILAREAMRALELISDTFLPVNELVQAAVPGVFSEGRGFLQTYREEIRGRWAAARSLLAGAPDCRFVDPGGGFYLTLDIGNTNEERAAETILTESHVLVHPGHFYDIRPEHLVISFVQETDTIRSALPAVLKALGREY